MSQYTSPTPVPGFLDPDDPTLFPRLTAAQIEQLAERAETLSLSPGEVLFEQGQRDTPFYVVLSGAIDVIDRQPDGDHYFTQCQPGTFAADISMFTGEPTLARGVIAEESSILALPPDALRALVASSTELGDLLLRTMITRREWLMGEGYGNELLIGKRSSGDAFAIRELLERNLVPFSWHDIDTDDESKALLDRLGIGADECPVLVRTHSVLRSSDGHPGRRRARSARQGRSEDLRRGGARRGPRGIGHRRLRLVGGPFHAGHRALRPGRPSGNQRIGSRTTSAFRPVCPGQT